MHTRTHKNIFILFYFLIRFSWAIFGIEWNITCRWKLSVQFHGFVINHRIRLQIYRRYWLMMSAMMMMMKLRPGHFQIAHKKWVWSFMFCFVSFVYQNSEQSSSARLDREKCKFWLLPFFKSQKWLKSCDEIIVETPKKLSSITWSTCASNLNFSQSLLSLILLRQRKSRAARVRRAIKVANLAPHGKRNNNKKMKQKMWLAGAKQGRA